MNEGFDRHGNIRRSSSLDKNQNGHSRDASETPNPTQENPWPGRLNNKGRLSPIANKESPADDVKVKSRDGRRRKICPEEGLELSGGKTGSTVPVLPKIDECENSECERRSKSTSTGSSESTSGRSTQRNPSEESRDDVSDVHVPKTRLVKVGERKNDEGSKSRHTTTQRPRMSTADRTSVVPLVPIIETEAKYLRKQYPAVDVENSPSTKSKTWTTERKGNRRDPDRDSISSDIFKIEQEIRNAELAGLSRRSKVNDDQSIDGVMPFEPGDIADSDSDEEVDSPGKKKTMYKEIGTVFREYFDEDDDETPDSSHGDSFFQRRKYWVV